MSATLTDQCADFLVLDVLVDQELPLLLGRLFLSTCGALIDLGRGTSTIDDGGTETHLLNKSKSKNQKFDETFYEAWDRFNDLFKGILLIMGFRIAFKLETFYNALKLIDSDSLNSAARSALILDRKTPNPASARKAVEKSVVTGGVSIESDYGGRRTRFRDGDVGRGGLEEAAQCSHLDEDDNLKYGPIAPLFLDIEDDMERALAMEAYFSPFKNYV
ncbi:hypothetical protein Tco_0793151 [Tanacetum coccineum]